MSTLIKTHSAVDVDFSQRLLEVACPGGEENFYLPYDKLVIACGSVNSTHGVPGLENCFQLKTVQDAQGIRRRVMDNLEKAALPSTTEEERRRLLSFVVCGGGPTGVEFASELWEMVNEDVLNCECRVLPSMPYDYGPCRSESTTYFFLVSVLELKRLGRAPSAQTCPKSSETRSRSTSSSRETTSSTPTPRRSPNTPR